ncbi:MAG: hypothetical protein KGJ32_03030 [Xanthomonadaceae bacterium]|nr:hypothetical protein [Xanthomonadaceae bacterium]
MSWRERLATQRAEKIQKVPGDLLTKPTKGAFVSFVSTPDGHSEKIAASSDPAVRVNIRPVLLELADRLGIDGVHVHRIPSADLALWAAIPDGSLRAFLLALDDTATRQAGKVPLDDTAAIHCRHCGPVYAHPGIAAVLPVVDGWPRALGCPWCAIRKAGGYIPRPLVTCGDCQYFTPDTINPPAGMGTCASGHGMHYPMKAHRCAGYLISTEKRDLA